jgi:hypothetical protein
MMGISLLRLSRNDFELRVKKEYSGGNHEKCEKDLRGSLFLLGVDVLKIILIIIY